MARGGALRGAVLPAVEETGAGGGKSVSPLRRRLPDPIRLEAGVTKSRTFSRRLSVIPGRFREGLRPSRSRINAAREPVAQVTRASFYALCVCARDTRFGGV